MGGKEGGAEDRGEGIRRGGGGEEMDSRRGKVAESTVSYISSCCEKCTTQCSLAAADPLLGFTFPPTTSDYDCVTTELRRDGWMG